MLPLSACRDPTNCSWFTCAWQGNKLNSDLLWWSFCYWLHSLHFTATLKTGVQVLPLLASFPLIFNPLKYGFCFYQTTLELFWWKSTNIMYSWFTKPVFYFYFQFWVMACIEFDHFCLEISLNSGFFIMISSLFPSYLLFILLSPFLCFWFLYLKWSFKHYFSSKPLY